MFQKGREIRESARNLKEWVLSNPPILERSFEVAGVLLFLTLTLIFALKPIRTFDPWWHLATGKWIFTHHQIPHTDPFSHTCQGCRWIDLCWLFQVLAYLAYKAGGLRGFWLLKVVVVTITMVLFYLVLRRRTANRYLTILFALLAVVIVQMRFMARPHILGFLCLIIFTETIQRWFDGGKVWALCVAVFTYLVWINSHGSFLVAFAVWGAIFLGSSIDYLGLHMRELIRQRWLHRHLLLLGLLGVASLATPYGLQMFVFAITSHLGKGADATRNIAEWHPMRWKQVFNLVPGTRDSSWGMLFLTAALVTVAGMKRERRSAITATVLLAFSLFLSLKHARFVAISALLLVPWMATLTSKMERRTQAALALILLFYLTPLSWKAFEIPRITSDYGKVVASSYPWDLTGFLRNSGVKGNMMNQYAFGGFYIWRLYPSCRVYIDGRTPTVYSPFQFWLYRQTDRSKQVMQSEIGRTNINIAVVKRNSKPSRWFWDNSTWCLAMMDDENALYLENSTANQKGIPCFRHLKPFASAESLAKGNQTKEVKRELERLLDITPHSTYPHLGLAELFLKDNKTEMAIAEVRRAIAIRPKSVSLHFKLGKMLASDNRTAEAIGEMKMVLKLNPRAAPAVKELGILLYQAEEYEGAEKKLRRYLEMVGDADMRTYAFLGLAQYEMLDVDEALDSFTKAVVLCPKKSLKKVYYNYIGNCYWGLKRYKEAINSYRLALKIDPEYQDARENLRTLLAMVSGKKGMKWKPKRSGELEKKLR